MGSELEDLANVVAPELGLSARVAKWVLIGVPLLIAVLLLGWIVWKLFLAAPAAQAKHDIIQAHGQAVVGQAQGEAGAHAANVVANGAAKETIINTTTRTNYVEITKQPGAGDPVSDAVDTAFRHAVCLRASAAGLPDCQRLQEAGP